MSDLVGNPEDRFSRVAAQGDDDEFFTVTSVRLYSGNFSTHSLRKLVHAMYRDFFFICIK